MLAQQRPGGGHGAIHQALDLLIDHLSQRIAIYLRSKQTEQNEEGSSLVPNIPRT